MRRCGRPLRKPEASAPWLLSRDVTSDAFTKSLRSSLYPVCHSLTLDKPHKSQWSVQHARLLLFPPCFCEAGRWRDVAHYLASFSVSPYHDCYKPNVCTSKAGHSLSITQSQHHKSRRVSRVRHMTEMTAWKPLGQGSGAVFDPLGLSEVRAKWAFGSAFGSSFFGPFWLCWKEVHQIPSPQLRLCMEGLNNNSMLELWRHKISRTCRIHKPLTRVLFPTWARKKVMARSYKRLSRELGSEFLLN